MIDQSNISRVRETRIRCDGAVEAAPALGHPRVWLQIDESGLAICRYCDRRFILIGGAADKGRR